MKEPSIGKENLGAVIGAVLAALGGLVAIAIPSALMSGNLKMLSAARTIGLIGFVISTPIGWFAGGYLCAALEARLGSFVELTHSSPHGDELLDEHNRVCGDIAAASRAVAVKILTRLVRDATAAGELDPASVGLSPATAAAILLDCAEAAKTEPAVAPRAFRRRLAQIVRTLVAGMRPQAAHPALP